MARFEHYDQGTPSWIELNTTDQAAAQTFYGGLFGWDFNDYDMGEMGHYYIPTLEGDDIGGLGGMPPGTEGHPPYWGVYLAVDDVDASAAKVEPAGGTVIAGPFDVDDNGRMAMVQDPTGAFVGLWQAGKTIGTQRANEPNTPVWNECVTADPDRALAFYTDVLGMGGEPMDMGEMTYTVLTNVEGKQVGGLVPLSMLPEGTPPHWNVYFNVADVDASAARAEELGASVAAPAFDVPTVGRMAMLADPQGAMFWVMQAPPESA